MASILYLLLCVVVILGMAVLIAWLTFLLVMMYLLPALLLIGAMF